MANKNPNSLTVKAVPAEKGKAERVSINGEVYSADAVLAAVNTARTVRSTATYSESIAPVETTAEPPAA